MNKSAKSEIEGKPRGTAGLHLPGMVREALYDTVNRSGPACVTKFWKGSGWRCRERYEHLADRQRCVRTRGELAGAGGRRLRSAAAGAQCGGSRA